MSSLLTKLAADFETQLATAISVGGTTATLLSETDDDGNTIPDGNYVLALERTSSNKEYIRCVKTGTSLTSIQSLSRQGALTTGCVRAHRIGTTVTITDWAQLKYLTDLLSGATDLDSTDPLKYDGTASISNDAHLATKKYVDDTAIQGAPDATNSVKGITKLSVAAVSATDPIAVGDNDGRVPTQGENDALVGNNTDVAVGTGNKFVTQTGLQHNAEKFAADAGANDTYVVTLSPAPTSYTDGMVIYFKANTVNTGAATINVNGLGAKTIVKGVSTTLSDGDILAGQYCTLIYNGTNMVLQNPVGLNASPIIYKNGTSTRAYNAASGSQTIAHGLGITPKLVRISAYHTSNAIVGGVTSYVPSFSIGVYNGTTTSTIVGLRATNGGSTGLDSTNIVYIFETISATDASQVATISVDSTNITLSWTKVGTLGNTENINLLWEAQA